jgi:hypothetical protein
VTLYSQIFTKVSDDLDASSSVYKGLVNCCWLSPAQSSFDLGPVGIHDHISRLLRVLKWDLLSDKMRGLTITGHSPSTGGGNAPQKKKNVPGGGGRDKKLELKANQWDRNEMKGTLRT